jgi:hypothetical protein
MRKSEADIIGGILTTEPSSGLWSKAIAACQSTWFGVGNSRDRIYGQSGKSDVAAFPCIRREVFAKIGLFREEQKSNADLEFLGRARKAGLKIYMDSRIKSKYFPRSSLKNLAKQMYRNGKWLPAQLDAIRIRHLTPFVFVIAIISLPIIALSMSFFWIIWFLMIISYLGFGIASAIFYTRRQLKPIDRLKMVPCYFVIHFSYGIGWIHGLFSKEVREAKRLKKLSAPPKIHSELDTPLLEITI